MFSDDDATPSHLPEPDSPWDAPPERDAGAGRDGSDGGEDRRTGRAEGPRDLQVEIDRIRPARYQARKHATERGLAELTRSVNKHGILEPLLVRKKGDLYELIAGARRLHAARQAGLLTVPVRVLEATDEQAELWTITENLQREDISPWEEAEAVAEVRLRRKARGQDASGAAVAELFEWSEAKVSERRTIVEQITPEVWERAGITQVDLYRLSKTCLLRAAQGATVEARADLLRNAVRPPADGSSGAMPKKKGRPRSAPAASFSLKRAANGILTLRIDPTRTGQEETRRAISEIEPILDLLSRRSQHFGNETA